MPEARTGAGIRRNFGLFYGLRFWGEFYLIAPVLILYYTSHGLNSTQIFTIQAAFHATVLMLEVPSGYLADVIGRRRTLVLGAAAFPLGLAVYAVGRGFAAFVLAEMVIAAGASLRTGSDSALVFDSLRGLGREADYKRTEGRGAMLARIGSAVSSVAGGGLAAVFLRLPFLVNTATALLMPPLALALVEPDRPTRRSPNPLGDILGICRYVLREPRLRPVVLLCGLLMSCHLTGLWAYFLYYRTLGIGVGWLGIFFAVFQLAGALGGSVSHAFSERFGAGAVLFAALCSPLFFILLGVFPSVGLIPLIPANAFLWNLAYPVLLERLNLSVGSDVRATVLSLAFMAGSVLFVAISPLFGLVSDLVSLRTAFVILGVFFGSAGVPLLGSVIRRNLPPRG